MSSKEHEDRLGQSETGWAEMQGSEGQAHRAPGPAVLPGGTGTPGRGWGRGWPLWSRAAQHASGQGL